MSSEFEKLNWTELELRAADGSPHGYQAMAAARAEIRRRDIARRSAEWDVRERSRIQAQQFQEKLVDRQIAATTEVQSTQLEIAKASASAAKLAAWATAAAALFTAGQLVLQAIK